MAEQAPWLLVGLGNPGAKYARNRHNVGFMVADAFADAHADLAAGPPAWRDKHKAAVLGMQRGVPGGGRCVVMKPQTFMNCSGDSVAPAARFHRTPVERIVVVHDELDFAFGRVGLKRGGGHGGHNGLRDLIRALGSRDFLRVRVGIGRPTLGEPAAYVLADFSAEDRAELPAVVDHARRAVDAVMADGIDSAMHQFHGSAATKPEGRVR